MFHPPTAFEISLPLRSKGESFRGVLVQGLRHQRDQIADHARVIEQRFDNGMGEFYRREIRLSDFARTGLLIQHRVSFRGGLIARLVYVRGKMAVGSPPLNYIEVCSLSSAYQLPRTNGRSATSPPMALSPADIVTLVPGTR